MAEQQVSFKDTLNLPRTDFPIRANAQEMDASLIARWQQEDLYRATFDLHIGAKKFILHDGPPYANGHIHLGHAYNKILKDIVLKSRRMSGYHVPCTPGWDCHGLPIELKVTQENPELAAHELKGACRVYAQKWIDIQRNEFKSLGVMMDFDRPYITMSFAYEASILQAFAQFVSGGYVERKNKTVPWCISCQTVLAAAEIEYEDRKDPSVYVKFKLNGPVPEKIFSGITSQPTFCVIWTTTPWTLPLNRAVLLRPDTNYSVLDWEGQYLIIGAQLVDAFCAMLQVKKDIVTTFNSNLLIEYNAQVSHPFINDMVVPLIADHSVELSEGTAFVHCAPGAGPTDYEVGLKHKLPIFSPVSSDGKYTTDVLPADLAGKSIIDGQGLVISKLLENHALVSKGTIKHSYPHCWRCHKGLIFRATKQWFFNLDKDGMKQKTLNVVTDLAMYPESSRNRLRATLDSRLEWCISRQRVWGVPIPALICIGCDYTYMSSELIMRVAQQVSVHGIEYWNTVPVSELTPPSLCPQCGISSWQKEMDILDVWFESGVSHYAVLQKNLELGFPADLYVEGKDQHRAWFQSSLLISMALNDETCTKGFLTHGFTVDAHGKKMSKSLGNVIAPQDIIDKLGTDGLRLWVASIDYADDAVVSEKLLINVQEVLRKVRNTCRFLLSNLYDFDIDKDAVEIKTLRPLDLYALRELQVLSRDILHSYEAYNFTAVFHRLADYCSVDLSSFYLDIVKDRLYVEKADGHERRSAQTVCWHILDSLVRLMAPILSFTSEQIFDYYKKDGIGSIHLQTFTQVADLQIDLPGDSAEWSLIKNLRSALLKSIEEKRAVGLIKHPLEVHLELFIAFEGMQAKLFESFIRQLELKKQSLEGFIKELLIVSQVSFIDGGSSLPVTVLPGVYAQITHAQGNKCPRCWQWSIAQNLHHLCNRCTEIVY